MRKIFIIIFLFSFGRLWAQLPTTEGMIIFDDDITKVLLDHNNKKIEITLHILLDQQKGKRPLFKEKIAYKFLNDSIVQQSYEDEKDFGVIRNGRIFEYDIKLNKIIQDINTYVKIDTLTIDSTKPPHRFITENKGDTLETTKTYYLENGNWTLKRNDHFHRSTSADGKYSLDSNIVTEVVIKHELRTVTITKTYRTFDIKDRLIKVEKFDSSNDVTEWNRKNTLLINYKEK